MCPTPTEEIVQSLVHDLRQPLGNIEISIFCLHMMLDHPSDGVRQQLRTMERQVAQATVLLQRAVDELRALRTQRDTAGESFDRTKSATAAVT